MLKWLEQRRDARSMVALSAQWDSSGRSVPMAVHDLSRSGAGLAGVLPVGQWGWLRFAHEGQYYDFSAVVVWADLALGRCGVEFVLNPRDAQRVTRLSRRLPRRFRQRAPETVPVAPPAGDAEGLPQA